MTINPPLNQIPSEYNFRNATNKDQKAVQTLIFSVLKEYGLSPEPNKTDKDLSDLELNYKNGYFGIIQHGTKTVATFALYPLSKYQVEIRKMYADKSVRNKGLGKWMVNYLLQIAEENGYSEVELETASCLKEALYLYEKMGFLEKKFENKTPRCDKAFYLKLNN